MKDEYDFSKGERGKFYQSNAKFSLPIYLDDDVFSYLAEKANNKGVEVGTLVNEILKKDIELIEGVK